MGKKNNLLMWLMLGILAVSCKQSAIFYAISQEVEPVDPRIDGMPTNIVKLGDTVYVASRFNGDIQRYADGSWKNLNQQPGGKILELAGTDAYLYALTGDPGSAGVSRYDPAEGGWQTITVSGNMQVIYGAGEYLFASVMHGSGFDIQYARDGDTSFTDLKTETKLLKGAAVLDGVYYLATAGDGIFTFDGDSAQGPTAINGEAEAKANITGVITVMNTIVAVSKGSILYGNAEGFTAVSGGVTFTGGLGLWEGVVTKKNENEEDEEVPLKLLLLGTQGASGSTTHGYREIVLTAEGTLNPDAMGLYSPGTHDNSSVRNADKYNSSLRRYPVIGFLQAPDTILFAATVKSGLWAYRNNVWNAEE
ncbi:MAG: hypothetical protein LBG87_05570 [Spirochaetaceae bacterium]|jgi:hypothetical protein|nr:hypothetical protein [Spirochaetaceae bacterium]